MHKRNHTPIIFWLADDCLTNVINARAYFEAPLKKPPCRGLSHGTRMFVGFGFDKPTSGLDSSSDVVGQRLELVRLGRRFARKRTLLPRRWFARGAFRAIKVPEGGATHFPRASVSLSYRKPALP
jgi:hypothetical protein